MYRKNFDVIPQIYSKEITVDNEGNVITITGDSINIQNYEQTYFSTVTTSGSSVSIIATIPTNLNTGYFIEADYWCKENSDNYRVNGYKRIYRAKNVNNTVTVGTFSTLSTLEDTGITDANVGISYQNQDLFLIVTGSSNAILEWKALYKVRTV